MPSLPEIREKFPQYQGMSDQELADALYQKFYSDMPRADFDQKVGLSQEPQPHVPVPAFGSNPMDVAKMLLFGDRNRTAEDVNLPAMEATAAEVGSQLPDPALALGGLGMTAGAISPLPGGAAVGGALGAGGGQALKDYLGQGQVDPIQAAIAAAAGGAPGAVGKAVAPAGRLAREFLPDAVGAASGGLLGSSVGGFGTITGAYLGRKVGAAASGRTAPLSKRAAQALRRKRKKKRDKEELESKEPGRTSEVRSNAEREAELRRLLGEGSP